MYGPSKVAVFAPGPIVGAGASSAPLVAVVAVVAVEPDVASDPGLGRAAQPAATEIQSPKSPKTPRRATTPIILGGMTFPSRKPAP